MVAARLTDEDAALVLTSMTADDVAAARLTDECAVRSARLAILDAG